MTLSGLEKQRLTSSASAAKVHVAGTLAANAPSMLGEDQIECERRGKELDDKPRGATAIPRSPLFESEGILVTDWERVAAAATKGQGSRPEARTIGRTFVDVRRGACLGSPRSLKHTAFAGVPLAQTVDATKSVPAGTSLVPNLAQTARRLRPRWCWLARYLRRRLLGYLRRSRTALLVTFLTEHVAVSMPNDATVAFKSSRKVIFALSRRRTWQCAIDLPRVHLQGSRCP